jgi:hypothetical protein
MKALEVFIWAIVGGLFVVLLITASIYYNNKLPTNKQLSRDFLIGSAFTGFLYPLIPESFDEIKNVITTTATEIQALKPITLSGSLTGDQDIKIGPANF